MTCFKNSRMQRVQRKDFLCSNFKEISILHLHATCFSVNPEQLGRETGR